MLEALPLTRAGASEGESARLSARGIRNASELMRTDLLDVSDALRVSVAEANRALLRVSRVVAPPPTDAYTLLRKEAGSYLKTGILRLDEALRGGIPRRRVTELAGPAGAGKTQFCFGLLLSASLPKEHGGMERFSMYVDAERKFRASRVEEMARARCGPGLNELVVRETLSRILVVPPPQNASNMKPFLLGLASTAKERNVVLVVVDSVAALSREEGSCLEDLRRVADSCDASLAITHQVSGAGSYDSYSLGLRWSHEVHTRLAIEREGEGDRKIYVIQSPLAPRLELDCVLNRRGLLDESSASELER